MSFLFSPNRESLLSEIDNKKSVYILLHGFLGSSDNLFSLIKVFSNIGVPILYDLPNHGKSPTLKECTFFAMAEMLHKTLIKDVFSLGIQRVHLIGHSLGGKLASMYSLLYPETVDSLVVLDIAPVTYPPLHQNEINALVDLYKELPQVANKEQARNIIEKHITSKVTVGFLMKNVYLDSDGVMQISVPVSYINNNYKTICSFPREELNDKFYTGPTLFVKGIHSDYILSDYYEIIEHFFPAWELEEIDAGHILHVEKPKELQGILSDFYVAHC